MTQELSIPSEDSALSALLDEPSGTPLATVLLAHGSGAGKDHPFMSGYANALAEAGARVVRFNFPYMDAGKKFPDKAPRAVAVWSQVMHWAAQTYDGPLVAAGKSFGGRMASLAAAEGMPAAALVFLGYPWHTPKTPQKLRAEHLASLTVPLLFLQGTRDQFASSDLLPEAIAQLPDDTEFRWFDGGDHSFKTARSGRSVDQDGAQLAAATAQFLRKLSDA